MGCQLKSEIVNGALVIRYKKRYDTLEIAQSEAVKMNNRGNQIYKVQVYQCVKCGGFHLGTSDNAIPRKL